MSKHSPGPWTAKAGDGRWIVSRGIKCCEAIVTGGNAQDDAADAHLIATAPELFAVLSQLAPLAQHREGELDVHLTVPGQLWLRVSEALKKAGQE